MELNLTRQVTVQDLDLPALVKLPLSDPETAGGAEIKHTWLHESTVTTELQKFIVFSQHQHASMFHMNLWSISVWSLPIRDQRKENPNIPLKRMWKNPQDCRNDSVINFQTSIM